MSDSGGLYIEINPKGAKYWRLKYRFAGKEKRLAPDVSLKEPEKNSMMPSAYLPMTQIQVKRAKHRSLL